MNNLSLLVASFDNVDDILFLWDNYSFKKYPNIFSEYQIFYGLNFKKKKELDFKNKKILYSNTFDWSLSLERWIDQIKTKYILIILDDQIIKNISLDALELILKNIEENDIVYAPLTYASHLYKKILSKKNTLSSKVINDKYSINLQPSIWRKEHIINLLKRAKNPWEFETISSKEYNKNKFNAYFFISKDIIFYEQYIERGKIYPNRFFNIFKKNHKYLLQRETLDMKRRFSSHLGYIYRIIKEFIKASLSLLLC